MLLSPKPILLSSLYRTRSYFNNPFKDIPKKPLWREQLMLRALPKTRYVIFFTPRSGSSRLTDLVENAGGLCSPSEAFNPLLIRKAAIFLGAQNLDDYLGLLMRHRSTNGTFGCEITIPHLYNIFFSDQKFFELYRPTSSIFLFREDIIGQAISLSRLSQTSFTHQTSSSFPQSTSLNFEYKPAQIRKELYNLLSMERQLERIFRQRSMKPLRLSYEMLINTQPETFLPRIARHVGGSFCRINDIASEHRKIVDQRNVEFAFQFRSENQRLIAKIDKQRTLTFKLAGLT